MKCYSRKTMHRKKKDLVFDLKHKYTKKNIKLTLFKKKVLLEKEPD